ncbi:hypothetical protein Pla110_19720 [Polystyrenella longa]|uniref:DUF1003 domain-containing protein n=1 Tax=Polystyrenella longa TaxID=2528007 RepID=A0A518CLZ4_9PLAN|nr:DUF1003 domain-containing protein [Polystyrenella longa]QDU80248.1 hypothetical protein Pla110_19720 [Polystyrenella longa]
MSNHHAGKHVECQVCHHSFPLNHTMPLGLVRPVVLEEMELDHSGVNQEGYICLRDLNEYRSRYMQHALEAEKGELNDLEKEVVTSLREQEDLSQNLNNEFAGKRTLGEQVSDHIAEVGGSWSFILTFGVLLVCWIAVNSAWIIANPFDPYPFILLNLALSCLAAIQAPVIMMSQKRQENKDRLQAEHDYRINLKTELEVRHIHAKLDLLLTHQWERLLTIQQLQTDLIKEIADKKQS